jgi:recombinational DNA repair ATPase RecF
MPSTLERITINGFKSIRELKLQLEPLNILIGANGAGKSNFIGAFRLLNEILESRLQVYSIQLLKGQIRYYISVRTLLKNWPSSLILARMAMKQIWFLHGMIHSCLLRKSFGITTRPNIEIR